MTNLAHDDAAINMRETASNAVASTKKEQQRSRIMRVKPCDPTAPATVSVVIPCFNYARYLPQAVESVLSQSHADVKVIIVDDKSTDDSLAVAKGLAAGDNRITVIAHQINRGPVVTFNDGLAAADGEFVVRLDADDLLTPGSLRRSIAVMQRFPNVGLVYGHPLHFEDGHKLPAHRDTAASWTVWDGRAWLESRCKDANNVITSPEVLMRRSIVDSVGGQMPLPHTHDMEMWFRIAAFSDVAYIRGSDQAWHRDHARSLSAREVSVMRDLTERRDAFATLFGGMAGGLPQAAEMHSRAKKALAEQAVTLAVRRFDQNAVNDVEIETLREFARKTVGSTAAIAGWAGLDRRIRMGADKAQKRPRFVAERVLRGLRARYSLWKWHRTGEF